MKCAYCGEELKEGGLFCPSCGKAVQIVPDYNEFDDEFLNTLVAKSVEKEKRKERLKKKKEIEAKRLQQQKERHIRLFVILGVAFLLVLMILFGIVSYHEKKMLENSYDYQIQKAQDALKCNDRESAIAYYEKALSMDASDIDVHFSLAKLYQEEGYTDAAVLHYNQIIQCDVDNGQAFQALIEIYEQKHLLDEILKLRNIANERLQRELFSAYMVANPDFDRKDGTYNNFFELEIHSVDQSDIFYSMDGTDPIANGILYENPIILDEEKTYQIQAVCLNAKGIYSDIITGTYTIIIPPPKMPEVSPDGGSFVTETTVFVQVPRNCVAYYTWDGKNPNGSSKKYQGYIVVPEGNNVLSVVLYDTVTKKFGDIYRGRFEYYAD